MTKPLLPAEWTVPQIFRDRVGDTVGRQRVMSADDHLLLILHGVPQSGEHYRQPLIIWRSPDGEWTSHSGDEGKAALTKHIDAYEATITALDELEHETTGAHQYVTLMMQLAPVLRATRHLHAVLQEARDACSEERLLINARDQAYRLERTIELLMTDARGSLDVATLHQQEKQEEASLAMAQSAHRLNMLAAFFFPLVTLCSIVGVAFEFKDYPTYEPFYGMLGIGLFVGLVLTIVVRPRGRQ